jgi:hypothetical protein
MLLQVSPNGNTELMISTGLPERFRQDNRPPVGQSRRHNLIGRIRRK